MSKIIGVTVGTTAPRPNWTEENARSAAYIKNKPIIDPTLTTEGAIADAKATGDAINQLQANIDEVAGLVGDLPVEHSHDDRYYTESEIDSMMVYLNTIYDEKGSATSALDSANEYTDTVVGELSDGFSDVIYQMYGNDLTEEGAPTIRSIANDAANTSLEAAKRYINSAIKEKADSLHIHDDRYYTETEIDGMFNAMQSDIDSKVDAVDGMGLSTNDYTTAEKDKLATVESDANFYEHPTHTSHSSGLYKVTVDDEGHVSEATSVEKDDILAFIEKNDIVDLGFMDEDSVSSEISDLNDRIDGVDGEIGKINEALGDFSEQFEKYKEDNDKAVSTNTGDIESNKNAIKAIEDDYLKSTDRTQILDEIEKASKKATANATAIEKLNGDEHTEGSVKQSINAAFNEFAANITNNETIDTYKELIDYAAKHVPEFAGLVGEVGGIDSRVGTIEADLPDYKETVTSRFDGIDQAIEGYINDTQEALDGKADVEHTHEVGEVNGLQDLVDELQFNIDTHSERQDNPHTVTAEQVGAYTRDDVDAKIASIETYLDLDESGVLFLNTNLLALAEEREW